MLHKIHISSLACLIVMAAGAVAHAAEAPGLGFMHGDWEITCDNTRTCRAAGYHSESVSDDGDAEPNVEPNAEPLPVSVLLTRNAGPHAPVRAELQIGNAGAEDEKDELHLPLALTMSINGQALGKVAIVNDSWTADLTPAQNKALLAALTRASKIAWSDGKRTWRLSDKGAAAVLLKMDEFQGRLGTPGALVRKGTRDEGSVLPALPAPVVVAAAVPGPEPLRWPRARLKSLRDALKVSSDECPDLNETGKLEDALTVQRLSGGKLLASLTCWSGAYNQGSAYWVINANPPYAPEQVTTDAAGYMDGKIDGSQKGRGIGDCWSFNFWTWDGKRFVHTSEGTTGQCRMVAPGGPWSLPVLVTTVREAPPARP